MGPVRKTGRNPKSVPAGLPPVTLAGRMAFMPPVRVLVLSVAPDVNVGGVVQVVTVRVPIRRRRAVRVAHSGCNVGKADKQRRSAAAGAA